MSLCPSVRRFLRDLTLALCIGLAATMAGAQSAAVAAPPGSKNFTPPPYVPNYFSNESGPVMHQPAPLPAAPQAPARTFRETEEPEGQVEAAAAKAERQVVRTVKGRERDRTAHAQSRTAGRLESTVARGRNARPVRVAARVEKPRAAKVAHADPHATKARPVSAKGRAGRG